ncbi:MAG TPA: M1 family peptidase [Acidobacteria bacterium]|nr:M1 family peptidase [Acidobacteriota bacterium]
MKRTVALVGSIMMVAALAPAAEPVDVASYDIQVRLTPETHRLRGTEVIRWTNTASVATDELWWHLYLNAFASNRTTFMRELGGARRKLRGGKVENPHWGWTRIAKLTLDDGTDLLAGLAFERPDDGNPDDFTVARVKLPRAIPPGGAIILHVGFEAQLPRVIARTGWAGDFYLMGQWFPKLGVFEDAGVRGRKTAGWNCHQFHASSEFYADFASWDVTVEVPEGWVVGATGVQTADEKGAEGTSRLRRVSFHADHVHDFAWTTAPGTLMTVVEAEFDPGRDVPKRWLDQATKLLERSAAELELPPVHLRLLIPTSQAGLAERMLRSARFGMAWYGLWYGLYPYPQLTIVSPPVTATEAGGMEYPTFITTGASRWMLWPPSSWMPLIEMVTIHEFGHQYFYGLIATNEFEQAWMDEGFNSFAEASCSTAVMRDHLAPDLKAYDPWLGDRMSSLGRRLPVKVDRFAWAYRSRGDYSYASYPRTAVLLKTLQGLAGPGPFARAMRTYAERWRFRHPGPKDFFATFSEATGKDWSWFFRQAFESDTTVDFGVMHVAQHREKAYQGFRWEDGRWKESEPAGKGDAGAATAGEKDGGPAPAAAPAATPTVAPEEKKNGGAEEPWEVTVQLGRPGSFRGPVEVELVWDGGKTERRTWDAQDRWTIWRMESPERLDRVIVDPDGIWAAESHRADNYWSRKDDTGAVTRRIWWLKELFQATGLMTLPWS